MILFCVFPKLAKYLKDKEHLVLANYATTDGTFIINFLFVNKCRQVAKKKGPDGNRQYAVDKCG
jgi:hypothetical protein